WRRAHHPVRPRSAIRVAAHRLCPAQPDPPQRSSADAGMEHRTEPAPHQRAESLSERRGIRLSGALHARDFGPQHAYVTGTGMGARIAVEDMEAEGADALHCAL